MAGYFLDTSALVKRYVEEAGSDVVVGLCDPDAGNDLVISVLAEIELVSATRRRVRERTMSVEDASTIYAWFKEDLAQQYEVRMLDTAVLGTAVSLLRDHALRAYDAVQLASAQVASAARGDRQLAPLVFVTADTQLDTVAETAGTEHLLVGAAGQA